ncbi:putative CtpA-like serine protease [Candidatus Hepatincola sp. Av]
MHKFSRSLISIIIFSTLFITATYSFYKYLTFFQQKSYNIQIKNPKSYTSINFLTEVMSIIKYSYYKDVSLSTLIDYAVQGMLQNLDPYSYILNSADTKKLKEETQGVLIGLGLHIAKVQSIAEVVEVVKNSPADKAGIAKGDYITHIGNTSVNSLSLEGISQKLQGKVGTSVTLKILRYPNTHLVTTLTRQPITINPLFIKVKNHILYIRISIFSKHLAKNLQSNIIKYQQKQQINGIILDVRNNPGGLLEQAVGVADLFINKGIIVYIHSKGKQNEIFTAKTPDITNNTQLVVLINQGSASASEIVAGALQDHHRATLIGTQSFGKGSVQSIIALNHNKFLKLTTGLYFLPNGETINNKGIQPDITIFANGKTCLSCTATHLNMLAKAELKYLATHKPSQSDLQLQYAYSFLQHKLRK